MTLRKMITVVALVVLGVLLAAGAFLGFCDVYQNHRQNHRATECGADCGTPPSSGTVRGGF